MEVPSAGALRCPRAARGLRWGGPAPARGSQRFIAGQGSARRTVKRI